MSKPETNPKLEAKGVQAGELLVIHKPNGSEAAFQARCSLDGSRNPVGVVESSTHVSPGLLAAPPSSDFGAASRNPGLEDAIPLGLRSLSLITLILLLCEVWVAEAVTEADCALRARTGYWEAYSSHTNQMRDAKAAWQYARACFDVGEFATNSNERAEIAEKGISICRGLLANDPKSAPGHYYLGMNLGQLARTRGLGALKLVGEMETEFKRARDLDEKFDEAGPDRNLGLLYRDAPRLASVGSRTKANHHLRKAAEVAPDFPENHLNLIESFLQWNDRNGARRELKAVEEIWAEAAKRLSGDAWACSWADWKKRLQQVKKKVEEPSKAIESPRGKD